MISSGGNERTPTGRRTLEKPLLVGIAGGTSAGKSTFAERITEKIGAGNALILAEESYYYDQSDKTEEERRRINFDTPEAIDFPLMAEHLRELIEGRPVPRLTYQPDVCVRAEAPDRLEPKRVILVEGILILAEKRIRDLLDLKIYIDADSDLRFIRRLEREMDEKGNEFEAVCARYIESVKPMHLKHVLHSKRYADVIVPQGAQNIPALRMVFSTIHTALHGPEGIG